jgi:hypothetical protein
MIIDRRNTVKITPERKDFPRLWIGFLISLVFFVLDLLEFTVFDTKEGFYHISWSFGLFVLALGYFMYCVYRLHIILDEITEGKYTVSPMNAVVSHFAPFYNVYWVFKWTNDLVEFINSHERVEPAQIFLPGFIMLFAVFFGWGIGIILWFFALLYLEKKLRGCFGLKRYVDIEE